VAKCSSSLAEVDVLAVHGWGREPRASRRDRNGRCGRSQFNGTESELRALRGATANSGTEDQIGRHLGNSTG